MKKIYTTAMGKPLDIESLKAIHEETIAVGNMKVNARGDSLGPGGTVESSRGAALKEYYRVPESSQAAVDDKIARQRAAGARTKKASVAKRTEKSPKAELESTPREQELEIAEEYVEETVETIEETVETAENNVSNEITENVPQPLFAAPVETNTQTSGANEPAPQQRMRGSLANSIAKQVTVTQTKRPDPRKPKGISRI
jgi:flagellar biosynthesis GTPase FlhF